MSTRDSQETLVSRRTPPDLHNAADDLVEMVPSNKLDQISEIRNLVFKLVITRKNSNQTELDLGPVNTAIITSHSAFL